MSVSVVIPTYNRKETLCQAIDSVLEQTHTAHEIIVVDDGSDDGTEETIKANYPDTRYLYHANRGVSYSRNRGVEAASGNWIAFLDNDDTWLPKKLELQISALQENPEYQLCHTEEIWIRNGVRVNQMNKHKKRGGDIYLDCLKLCVISPSSVLLSKELFEQVGGFDESLPACEDYDLWLRICAQQAVLFLETPLLTKYGGHEDQLSRKYWGMDRFRVQALNKMMNIENLDPCLKEATRNALLRKCNILIKGARKRENSELVNHYTALVTELRT
ncbi:MAG: glycosyltransferase [Pseudomonadales bacterium]|nr:glycosyltransferase [Pseudomonadales bacterium]